MVRRKYMFGKCFSRVSAIAAAATLAWMIPACSVESSVSSSSGPGSGSELGSGAGLGSVQRPINNGQLEPGQESTVLLYHTSQGVMCTGTIIGPRVVLTAKHCVRPNEGAGPGEFSASGWVVNVGPNMNQIYAQYGVQEVRYTPGSQVEDNDIAVMIISGVMSQTPYPIYSGSLDSGFVGDSVYLIGYGLDSCSGGSSGTKYRTTDQVVQLYGYNSFITQGKGANQGDSGGPVFNQNYEVVGVMVAIGNCYDGYTFCTRIDKFTELIQTALQDTGGCFPTGPEVCGDGIDNDCANGVDDGCAPLGSPCTGDDDCSSGLCLSLDGNRVCAQSCDPTAPSSGCSVGQYCSEISCGVGVCRTGVPGPGLFGSQCANDTQCESLYCRPAPDGSSYCGVPCEPNAGQCLPAEVCTPLAGGCGSCQPASLSGALRGLGELCSSGDECLSGICTEDVGILYCSLACLGATGCPEGYHCRDSFCVRGDPGSDGDPCVSSDDCLSPATCLSDSDFSYCAQVSCGAGSVCPPPTVCTTIGDVQVCSLPGEPVGSPCTSAADCESGACVPFDGESFCTQACDRVTPCPSTTFCTTSDTGALACAPNSTPADSPPSKPPVGGRGGCSTGGTAPSPLWAILGLALLWIRRRGVAFR